MATEAGAAPAMAAAAPLAIEHAPAKINLFLHVTGRRADGLHLLDSLVVFGSIGDSVTLTPDPGFRAIGPEARSVPDGADNSCRRAARLMGGGMGITLAKELPVGGGIGGGSADAAAVIRAMHRLGRPLPSPDAILALGADVPVCVHGGPARMQGVGERITPVRVPPLALVLANPRVPVATAAVFRALVHRDNPKAPPLPPGAAADVRRLAAWLEDQRNDLEAPARALVPAIDDVLSALRVLPGCLLARMSGSGATCFGLFETGRAAEQGAARLLEARPRWWIRSASTPHHAASGHQSRL